MRDRFILLLNAFEESRVLIENNTITIKNWTSIHTQLEYKLSNIEFKTEFLNSFEEYIEDLSQFKILLKNIQSNEFWHETTLIKLLLDISLIHLDLVIRLIEVCALGNEFAYISLTSLKWIAGNEQICIKLIQIWHICNIETQKEIISAIPEILDHSIHSKVVNNLLEILKDNRDFLPIIVNAFQNLILTDETESEIINLLVSNMIKMNISDIPMCLGFLFSSTTKTNSDELIPCIRKNLNLLFPNNLTETKFVLDIFYSSLKYKPLIGEKFIKSIINSDMKIMDIWLLYVLLSIDTFKDSFKNSFKRSKVNIKVIKSSLSIENSGIIEEYASGVVFFLTSLISLGFYSEAELGYRIFFSNHKEHEYIIFQSILRLVGSLNVKQVNCSLKILFYLCNGDPSRMRQFYNQIFGLVDFIEAMSIDDIRFLYGSLSAVDSAYDNTNSSLGILIRKQLSRTESEYQRFGIIGSIALASTLYPGSISISNELYEGSKSKTRNEKNYDKAKECLSVAMEKLEKTSNFGFFLDQLSDSISNGNFGIRLVFWLAEYSESCFTCRWIALKEESNDYYFSSIGNELEQNCIAIKRNLIMYPNEMQSFAPLLKLVFSTQSRIPEIQKRFLPLVLKSPVEICQFKTLYMEKQEQISKDEITFAISCLVHLINFIIELINGLLCDDNNRIGYSRKECIVEYITNLEDFENILRKLVGISQNKLSTPIGLEIEKDITRFEEWKTSWIRILSSKLSIVLSWPIQIENKIIKDDTVSIHCFHYILSDILRKYRNVFSKGLGDLIFLKDFEIFLLSAGNQINFLMQKSEMTSIECQISFKCLEMYLEILLLLLKSEFLISNEDIMNEFISSFCPKGFETTLLSLQSRLYRFLCKLFNEDTPFSLITLIVAVLQQLVKRDMSEFHEKLEIETSLFCESLLFKEWPKNMQTKNHLGIVIDIYINSAEHSLDILENLVEKVFVDFCESRINPKQFKFQESLTVTSFKIFFRICFERLVSMLKQNSVDIDYAYILYTERLVSIFSQLLAISRKFESDVNVLSTALTFGRLFISVFTNKISILDSLWSTYGTEICVLLKNIQTGTRTLDIILDHGKRIGKGVLQNNSASVKKSLELFIYTVKRLLNSHNMKSCFSQGILKRRFLDGTENKDPKYSSSSSCDSQSDEIGQNDESFSCSESE